MDKQTQLRLFAEFTATQSQTLIGKADDYAGSTDRLNNFKVAGAVTGLSAAQNCLSLIGTKVARLGSLLKDGRTPKNEAITDSVLDLANYAFLLHCILTEQQPVQCGYSELQPSEPIKPEDYPRISEMVNNLEKAAADIPPESDDEIGIGDTVYTAEIRYSMSGGYAIKKGEYKVIGVRKNIFIRLEGCGGEYSKNYFTKNKPQ